MSKMFQHSGDRFVDKSQTTWILYWMNLLGFSGRRLFLNYSFLMLHLNHKSYFYSNDNHCLTNRAF